jgi:hypothetical protein
MPGKCTTFQELSSGPLLCLQFWGTLICMNLLRIRCALFGASVQQIPNEPRQQLSTNAPRNLFKEEVNSPVKVTILEKEIPSRDFIYRATNDVLNHELIE